MGIIRRPSSNGSSPATKNNNVPTIADLSEYGLYVGPKGSEKFGTKGAGMTFKTTKWSFLFSSDEDGTPNLLNILEYLWDESPEFVMIQRELEKFIKEYSKWKKTKEAA